MRKQTTNPTTQAAGKKSKTKKASIFAISSALAFGLLAAPLLSNAASASLDDGAFCIQASSDEGKFKGERGGCKVAAPEAPAPVVPAPVETTPPAPVVTTPVIPIPDLAVAGVCATPDAARKVFTLSDTGVISEQTLDLNTGRFSKPVVVATTGVAEANSLGVTPQGEFFLASKSTGALYSHTPGGSTRQIAGSSIGASIAGASMIYKGVSEYYVGSLAKVEPRVVELTVYRQSSVAERTGVVFKTRIGDVSGVSGDFTFTSNGDLHVVAGGYENRIATVPFASFADLNAGTGEALVGVQPEGAYLSSGGTINGAAYIGSFLALTSSESLIAYEVNANGTPGRTTLTYRFTGTASSQIVDLASCQIS